MAAEGATVPLAPSPASALAHLPISKLRTPSSASGLSRFPPAPASTKGSLRTPSKVSNLTSPVTSSQPTSSPSTPASQSIPRDPSGKQEEVSLPDKDLRRSVSIASFPQPPKTRSTTTSNRGSGGSLPESEGGIRDRDSRASSIRIKRLKTKASTGSMNQRYYAHGATSRRGSKDDRLSEGRASDPVALAGLQSPPRSRSSSAQGSYSTSATTFEEPDENRSPGDEIGTRRRGRDSGSKEKESKGNVIVSVRVRPDVSANKASAREWLVDSRQSLVAYRGREGGDYYYDNVFAPYDKNHKVYDSSAKRLVRRVMEGYHGTVFAYGMTGTGKTFSMQGTRDSPGVIPLAITDIFSYIRETPHREFLLRVSYLEIYNEKIHDLLTPTTATSMGPGAPQPEEIKLREDNKRGVYAFPLKEEIVQSPTQLLRVIARGDQSRKTRSTQFNAQSSRSHAVVQIVVESRERAPAGSAANDKRTPLMPGGVRVSTLSMIDLAGSERAADSKERRAEGAHINKSLLTLGTVISKLSGDKDSHGNPTDKDGKHLPYRDSKLTRLLQPALSGNSLVSILCTIQTGSGGSEVTASGNTGETLNTLKFAARAKNNIVSHAKRAEEALGAAGDGGSRVLLERYRMEIQHLKTELEEQRKEQVKKVEEEEREPVRGDDQRHEEQILEIHLARTALTRRMEDLKRLIIDSRSSGVNANGKSSSFGNHSSLSLRQKSEPSSRTLRSLRSSASHSTIGRTTAPLSRNHSLGSTITAHKETSELQDSPGSSFEADEDDEGFIGEAKASSGARILSLQADLADKTRYITTLEKRLLQARRSSQSRTSLLLSPPNISTLEEDPMDTTAIIKEKDSQIAELRAQLEDKERMVSALRSAARKREGATVDPVSHVIMPPFATTSNTCQPPAQLAPPPVHKSSPSNSSGESSGSSLSIITPTKNPRPSVSPVQLLSPAKDDNREKDKIDKRKSIDEMTKILDGMISDRVQTGNLIVGANGAVKPAQERRKESFGAIPTVGALAAQLRPSSTISELDGH